MRLIALMLLMLAPAAFAATPAAQPDAGKRLRDFFEAEWEWGLKEFPEGATYRGDPRYNDRSTDISFEAIARRKARRRDVLARLERIPRASLSPEDQLSYDLYKRQLEMSIAGDRFPGELDPINQQGGIHQEFAILSTVTPFRNAKDYRDYIARLAAFPRTVDQTIALMEKGRQTGWIVPAVPVRDVPAAMKAQIPEAPEKSVHWKPFEKFPDTVPEAEREALRAEGRKRLAEDVIPAYRRLHDYFVTKYLPAARKEIGAWALPDGAAFYAHEVKRYTTTDKTPEEIHQIGLSEVARIRKQMEDIIRQVEFRGTFDEFTAFLRTDPRFYYKTADELLQGYRDICKRVDAQLPKLFWTLPRLPYGVMPTPEFEAPTSTTAYYREGSREASRPGYFVANTYKLETRPKYEMEALAVHEAVPGHHLQIALAQELEGLPKFRRYGGFTAFWEGWGLYAESLGPEMGLYTEPYSKFGQLTYEMWRAVRLVVDTGMHAMKWDRQRAIDFMKSNTAKTEHDITVEIDRYIVWPGQALAYKLGELKIKELRARAARELGEQFDVRRFHDAVLLAGALPLDVLEKRIDSWIADRKAGKP